MSFVWILKYFEMASLTRISSRSYASYLETGAFSDEASNDHGSLLPVSPIVLALEPRAIRRSLGSQRPRITKLT